VLFSTSSPLARRAVILVLIALPLAGYVATAAALHPPSATPSARAGAAPTAPPATTIDHVTSVARQRYATEVSGSRAHATLRRVGSDPALLSALASGDMNRVRSDVRSEFHRVWYHWHASRMRIFRGSSVVVDLGVPFVVAPSQMTLRDSHGASLGTLQVSMQDVIGFVRYMHRNYPVDVVVRGRGAAHVRTSLPAARKVTLPDSGTVTVSGTRYQVRSFTQTALGNEPVKVWILQAG
jgi:hypothetical protein